MSFRDRLVATIRAARPVLESPGVLVVGSEVPNLLEPGAAGTGDLDELEQAYAGLRAELRHAVRSNLTILSLLGPRDGMPDPRPRRADVAALLRRLETRDPDLP